MKPLATICLILCLIAIIEGVSAQSYFPYSRTSFTITVTKSGITENHIPENPKKVNTPKQRHISSNQTLATQAITINIQTVNATCRTVSGSISATASGGIPPYQYKINGEGPFDNGYYPTIKPGNHLVEVADADGNTTSATAVVGNTNEPPVVAVTSFTNPTTCESADGKFMVDASGGEPPYDYTLDMVNFTTTPSFENLAAGFYTVMVRDANGCIGIARVTLTNPYICGIPFGITYTSAFCEPEGIINVKYLGNDPPYENSLNGAPFGSNTEYSNIAPGQYTLHVRSGTGETTKFMFHVVKGCYPKPEAQVTDNSCNAADGRITLITHNGTPPYQYSIDGINFQTSNEFTGLTAGRFNIGVRDAAGVLARTEAHVNGGCYTVSENHTDVVCGNRNGSIEVTPSGGKQPYSYSINDGAFQPSNTFQSLDAGTYRITVMDADGVKKSVTVEIKNTTGPQSIAPSSPPACIGDNIKMTISVAGGTLPLQYSLNDIDYQLSPEFDIVGGQSYSVYVKDANGCKISRSYQSPIGCFELSVNVTPADCGVNNGRFSVNTTNGHPPFEYSVDGISFQTSNTFTNLSPRVYQLTVRDSENNMQKVNADVRSSCPQLGLNIQNATCGNSNGSIVATGANGQQPYQFSFDGIAYSTQSSFSGLSEGTYTVFMRDASGYIAQRQAVVSNTSNPGISVTSTDAICSTGGTVNISATGGTGKLWYSIDGTNFSSSPEFTQLQPGIYQANVTDNVGCKTSLPVEVSLVNDLAFVITGNITICEGDPASISVADPKLSYSYSWSSDDGSITGNTPYLNVVPVKTTEFTVTVTEGLCTASRSTVVAVHKLPVPDAGEDIIVCYGQTSRLNGSGGSAYHWSPSRYLSDASSNSPEVIKPIVSQVYELTVTDENGCQSSQSSSVSVSVIPPVEVFAGRDTAVTKDLPFQLNAIDVNSSGFINYEWTPSVGLNNPEIKDPVATLQSATVYSVRAITEAGCVSSDEIKIQVYKGPDIYVPNAFTPNRDAVNDELKIIPVGIKTFRHFTVFNRWGQRIYYSADPSKGWNGFTGAKPADVGTYMWVVEGVDFNNKVILKRGVVQLIR